MSNDRLLEISKKMLNRATGKQPPTLVEELRDAIEEIEGGRAYSVTKILDVPRTEITAQTFNHLNNYYASYAGEQNIINIQNAFREINGLSKVINAGKAIELEITGLYELAYRYGCVFIRFNG